MAIDGGFLSAISTEARDALRLLGGERSMTAGSPILLEGEHSGRIVVIHEGVVRVSTIQRDGTEALLGLRGRGEILGEMSMLDGLPRSATATALTDGCFQFINSGAFEDFLHRYPEAAIATARTLSTRLRQATEALTSFGAEAVPARLAKTMISLAERFGAPDDDGAIVIELPLSQEDLGGLVGASRDSVARTLRDWRAQGLVTTRRRSITLLDIDRIRTRCH